MRIPVLSGSPKGDRRDAMIPEETFAATVSGAAC